MNFEFILIGLFLIWSVFYMDKKKPNNLVLILGVLFLMLGYFVSSIKLYNFSINIFVLFGLVYLFLYAFIDKYTNKKNSLCGGLLIAIIYVLINFVKLDYNMFFTIYPFILICIIVNFINAFSIKESLIAIVFSFFLSEIFNLFFIQPKVNFVAIFDVNLVLCIVVCIGAKIIANIIKSKIWKVKYEKAN